MPGSAAAVKHASSCPTSHLSCPVCAWLDTHQCVMLTMWFGPYAHAKRGGADAARRKTSWSAPWLQAWRRLKLSGSGRRPRSSSWAKQPRWSAGLGSPQSWKRWAWALPERTEVLCRVAERSPYPGLKIMLTQALGAAGLCHMYGLSQCMCLWSWVCQAKACAHQAYFPRCIAWRAPPQGQACSN